MTYEMSHGIIICENRTDTGEFHVTKKNKMNT
jgi:hypothetical protein